MKLPTIHLRTPTIDDDERLLAAVEESLPELAAWMEWCRSGYAIEDARSWLAGQAPARERGEAYEFLLEDDAGRLLGTCGLNGINQLHSFANLGYWVRSSETGRGVAVAAVRAVAAWAFAETELERLEIVVMTGNHRSLRVADKAGARREGVLRARLRLAGRNHDAVMFSIVRGRD